MAIDFPSLLITDDDRDFRETLRSVFEPKGFRTLLASCGEEAVSIVQREEVHIALVDFHMPRLTGLETARELRSYRDELPCILISAALDEQIIAEAQEVPVYSVLAKPFGSSEVRQTVCEALQTFYNWTPN